MVPKAREVALDAKVPMDDVYGVHAVLMLNEYEQHSTVWRANSGQRSTARKRKDIPARYIR